MNRKQEIIFKESTVWKAILTMAIPAMINILVMILYNMADMFFIGQLGSSCVLIAKTLGEGDTQNVRTYSSLCTWGNATFGTVAVAAMAASDKVSMVVSMIQMGICMGVQPLMAYNYGAKNMARMKETFVSTLRQGIFFIFLIYVMNGLFGVTGKYLRLHCSRLPGGGWRRRPGCANTEIYPEHSIEILLAIVHKE